ncbi:MAG: hypothetical protein BGP21_10705 [Thiobacillus sp. 65-29]|nr:MAG: hypothetical protein BGP21_10705 [Thiobacillus sp. 65-29]
MTTNLNEAVELLSSGGVLDSLKEAAQDKNEAERAKLLVRLAEFERDETKRTAALANVRPALVQRIAELEAELNATRQELRQIDPGITPFTGDKLRGKLRRLADPRIGQAITQLRNLAAKARDSFQSTEFTERTFMGPLKRTSSNALEIADVCASVSEAVLELEGLLEAERPADLDKLLAEKIEPIKLAVQRLHGLN